MLLRQFFYVVTVSVFLTPSGEAQGHSGYTERQGAYFKVFTQAVTYREAVQTCATDGAHLVDIKTQELHDFLVNTIDAVDNTWTWSDGTLLSFTNWAPEEPKNESNRDCGQLWVTKDTTCSSPTAPTNGHVSSTSDSNAVGYDVTYSCDPGYQLAGASTSTCQADGTWSSDTPTCTAATCTSPTAPTNGDVSPTSDSNSVGTVVDYSCDSGYQLAGVARSTCQADGTWYPGSTTCTAVPGCTTPSITNGDVNEAEVTGSNGITKTVTFICDQGYVLDGAQTLTCLTDGNWDSPVPTCIVDSVPCASLSPPVHGSIQNGGQSTYDYDHVLRFTCDYGYSLQGDSSITCQTDGTWTGSVPTCSVITCPQLTTPTNGEMAGYNNVGDVKVFQCHTGHELQGAPNTTCLVTGEWSELVPNCTAVECPELTAPVDGSMYGSHFYQDIANFSCDVGYDLFGSSVSMCQANGEWSHPVPTCPPGECPLLTAPINGNKTGYNYIGHTVNFTCDPGYDLIGAANTTCLLNRTWTHLAPVCTAIECPTLPAPDNGGMSGSYSFLDILAFTCQSGYNLEGVTAITCQADRTWNGSAPNCTAVQCPPLTAPTNGSMTGAEYYPSSVQFQCDTGYNRVGATSIICQADAAWSGDPPVCNIVQCPKLITPAHTYMSNGSVYQDVVNFTCHVGYERQGLENITCKADGTWSDYPPTCIIKKCPLLAGPLNGALSGENSYLDVVLFTCNRGHEMQGAENITCRANRTWSGVVPTCTKLSQGSGRLPFGTSR
ncbi:CUB and sushi domain-containing protein 3-like [Branchiostoma lanceolatum]|uniref:CUB and sushi domain-containing protein 3-like n=1 Tax=Branchiostoma lanceolatum TaxID=7740 RepID=UPI0034521F5A